MGEWSPSCIEGEGCSCLLLLSVCMSPATWVLQVQWDCLISGQDKELFALNTPDFAAVVSSWEIGMSVSPATERRGMWCGHRSDKCPSPGGFCVTQPPWLFYCHCFVGRRAGRDMEILSGAFCCPKMEPTCSKLRFGAAQHRMGSAALTSAACATPTRPCWAPSLQCRWLLLR